MSGLAKKVGGAILGLAVMLAWWTLTGGGNGRAPDSSIPAEVFGGGATQVTVEASANEPAEMITMLFEPADRPHEKGAQAVEKFGPGPKSWTIRMPPGTGGYLELRSPAPKVGSHIEWVVKVNGREVARESQTLEEPLKEGYGFALMYEVDDFAQSPSSDDEED